MNNDNKDDKRQQYIKTTAMNNNNNDNDNDNIFISINKSILTKEGNNNMGDRSLPLLYIPILMLLEK